MACLTLPSFTGPVALPPALTDVLLCEDVLGADSSRANNWTKVWAATSAWGDRPCQTVIIFTTTSI